MGAGPRQGRPFGRFGAVLGLSAVAIVAGAMSWSALDLAPVPAQHPVVFGGSLVLGDTRPLTVVDLATGQVTVRLDGIDSQVGAANYAEVEPVPVQDGTMLVDRVTGSFNYLGADDFVDDPKGSGVSLGPLAGSTGALGLAAGQNAFVVRAGPASTVSLVGPSTVEAATGTTGPVAPLGSAGIAGTLDLAPGGTAVDGTALWALYESPTGCRAAQVSPDATDQSGLAVSSQPVGAGSCIQDALESDGRDVGLARPGRVDLLGPSGARSVVETPFTASARDLVPVTGASGRLWYLVAGPSGWSLFGVNGTGPAVGPFPLPGLGRSARPAVPALSGGFLYTLDESESPQPTLWAIDVTNGHMAPLSGQDRYPVRNATERDDFYAAQVVLDGPRVVFNDPASLEAVVVFTDGTRPPVVVDKSTAVAVSPTGPADLEASGPSESTVPTVPEHVADPRPPVPVVAPVSQQVTCARTTQKPYAPQVTALAPSPQTVLVQWSYQLLDQTDCEPDSWAVQVTAVDGGHQPGRTTEFVTGQQQYMFAGLRPTTTYQVVVTAMINEQSTPSAPATFTTTARGPDAPTSVTTTADGHGDWMVSWDPCTEAVDPNCVVPAAQWTVTGAACGGSFVGTPPSVEVPGGTDQVVVDAPALRLLGDSLSFSVQGSLASGLAGDPTADGACTRAWEAPVASEVTVAGSGAPAADDSITATLVATTSGDLAALMSSHPGQVQFVYQLAGETLGPTDLTRAVFKGMAAGSSSTPSVTVYPLGHPDAGVTVDGPPFEQTLDWPALSATATAAVDPQDPDRGHVTVALSPNTPVPVELTDPVLQCGGRSGATSTLPDQAIGASHSFGFDMTDLTDTGGHCTVGFTLTDTADPDPYGIPSPEIETGFDIGQVPNYKFRQGYAEACSNDPQSGNRCGPGGQPWQMVVTLSGPPPAVFAGAGWTVTAAVKDPHGGQQATPDLCSVTDPLGAPSFPQTVTLPGDCPVTEMDDVDLTVSFEYLGQVNQIDAGYPDNAQGSVVALPPASTTTSTTTTTTTLPGGTG